ncbi:MAG: cellulase family glycosylhydrolase [Opitutaceae bacterium]|nr:cellulase family glycosylhydrolase [Cytophagales bacterium]
MKINNIIKKRSFLWSTLLCILVTNYSRAQTPVERHGQLKVSGNRILDKNNNPVVLRGMSLFWSQWIGKYYNFNTVKWLRDDWCSNVIRASMAVDQGGYATRPSEKEKIIAVVDAAIELGIYVIIDFHIHDAPLYQSHSKTFFDEMSLKYKDNPNVLYEIWNEPLNVSWPDVIKPYSENIIEVIRANDPDNIIICGTRNWSQRVDEAAIDPIQRPNIAYTLHFYAATHRQTYRNYITTAMNRGIAVFVTEYGTCAADGNGDIDETETKTWWDFMERNFISYCNWSVADKVETSAVLKPRASVNGGWSTNELTLSGNLVRNHLRSLCSLTFPGGGTVNGIDESLESTNRRFIPNPFESSTTLISNSEFKYSVSDLYGVIHLSGHGKGSLSLGENMYPGIYFVKIIEQNKETILKIRKGLF